MRKDTFPHEVNHKTLAHPAGQHRQYNYLGIHLFLDLLDPDPLVIRGMVPAPGPSIIKQKEKEKIDSYCFVTSF